jgi:hypothetical protein
MNVAENIVDSLLEGEMPDWLKKKIHGKSEDDDEGETKDDGDDKAEKESSGGSKASSNVAAACGPAPGKVTNSI